MRPTKVYPFTIPAGGSFPLLAIGAYFKVLSASGTFEVTGDTFGQLGALLAGQGLRDTEFARLTFRDTSGANNALQVLVADASFVDDRITGEVAVIDGGLARTRSGAAFISTTGVNTSIATNNAALQLFNTSAAGGKSLVVEQIAAMINGNAPGGPITIGVGQTQLTTPFAFCNPKLAGATPSSIAQMRIQEGTPAAVGALISASMATLGVTGPYMAMVYVPKEPIVLPPGWGLTVFDGYGASIHSMWATFEHYEQSLL